MIRVKHILIIILILILGKVPVQAQRQVHSQGALSCSRIVEMNQDAYGFVWIATENGLNRFDGWKFVNYFHDDKEPTSLSGNMVRTLLTDKSGRLWIGTNNGLQYYCPYEDNFHSVSFPDNVHPSISDMVETYNGEIWVVTSGYGAFSVDPITLKVTYQEWITELCHTLFINCIYEDHSHRLWIAYLGNYLACISPESKTTEVYNLPPAPSPKVYDIEEDKEGRLFISTHNHLLYKAPDSSQLVPIPYKEHRSVDARSMIQSKNGLLLINSYSYGLLYLDTEKMELQSIENLRGHLATMAKGKIYAYIEDRTGNLWINSRHKGLSIIPNRPFLFDFWNFSTINPEGIVSALYKDKTGDLWVGYTDCTLYRIDAEGNIKDYLHTPKYVHCMLEDSEGTFWIGTQYGGMWQLNKRTGQCVPFPLFRDESVSQIIEGKNKVIYFGLQGTGFARYDLNTHQSELITYQSQLSTDVRLGNDWINALLYDSNELIWIGHATGINCYDPQKNIFLELACDSILNNHVCYALLEDDEHHLWIATDNGLYSYDKVTQTTLHLGKEEGMPSNIICGLATDSKGSIWCSTYKGFCQINQEDRRILKFFSENGLTDTEYTPSVFYQENKQRAYFGGIYGVTSFIPDSVCTPYQLHQPTLTQLHLNNRTVNARSLTPRRSAKTSALMDLHELYFSFDNTNLSLEFSTLEFHDCTNIYFEYRITELNTRWNKTELGENKITYNYLPPGSYTLEVRACENEVYSPVNRIIVHITPPWYQTTWAWLLYILLCLLLLGTVYRIWYRWQCRKRREMANEEKLRFFINIAHEIRSPITLILSPLTELIKKDYDETTLKALKTMQRNGNRILNLINQLLDIRRIDRGKMEIIYRRTDLVGFVADIFNMFDYQATKRGIRFSFQHDLDTLPVYLDCNNFDKVLMNLLMNAFKYTPDGGEITIKLTEGTNELVHTPLRHYAEIAILDSGIGLNEKEVEKIFERFYQSGSNTSLGFGIGLNLAKLLVELHHGTITATNRTDIQGSCFTVRIPLECSHLSDAEISETSLQSRPALELASDREEKPDKELARKSKTYNRVLIVDDDEEVRQYLERELGEFYKIQAFDNGSDALLCALQQRVNLIISDIVMPGMDGFELLKKVKNNANISHVPVILLTSQAEADNRLKGWEAKADAFITKPFDITELKALCDNLITTRSHLKGKFGNGQILESKIKSIEVKSNDEQLMERLMDIVNRNLADSSFTVEKLAEEVGLSRVSLHRKLKELAGVSTSEFIRDIRLRQAAKLLKKREINISQIGYAVGFSSIYTFSVAFKKLYGCSPKDYSEQEFSEG